LGSKPRLTLVIHEAFIYSSDGEYTDVLAPFLAESVRNGEAAVVVAQPARIRLLREALGADADGVSYFDANTWYRSPGSAFSSWLAELDAATGPVRAIGEVVFGNDPDGVHRWHRYESLLNRAFVNRDAWIVCPYDTRAHPAELIDIAGSTHRMIANGRRARLLSAAHFTEPELGAPLSSGHDRHTAQRQSSATIAAGDVTSLRRTITWPARAAGLPSPVVDDLVLAVADIAADGAAVSTAQAGGEWYCEVATPTSAPLDDARPGIVVGRIICDRVEVDEGADGARVRFVFGRPTVSSRARILDACTELFAANGVRETGVNAIAERAGVAKATLYAHFASKDELVAAWLRSPAVNWFDSLRAELEVRTDSPRDRLVLFFDLLAEWLAFDEFRGCRLLLTSLGSPVTDALAKRLGQIEQYLRETATAAGVRDPDDLASELIVLMAGANVTASVRSSLETVEAARRAAAELVAAS
jgi:AcrR family transcriptional regulator